MGLTGGLLLDSGVAPHGGVAKASQRLPTGFSGPWCETHYIDIATHNPIGPVSTAACLHLNLATPNMLLQELPRRPGESLADVIRSEHRWENGWLYASDAPGLGLEVDWDGLVANYPFEHEAFPIFHKADGSLTNW